jgi:hypothetical protein
MNLNPKLTRVTTIPVCRFRDPDHELIVVGCCGSSLEEEKKNCRWGTVLPCLPHGTSHPETWVLCTFVYMRCCFFSEFKEQGKNKKKKKKKQRRRSEAEEKKMKARRLQRKRALIALFSIT